MEASQAGHGMGRQWMLHMEVGEAVVGCRAACGTAAGRSLMAHAKKEAMGKCTARCMCRRQCM